MATTSTWSTLSNGLGETDKRNLEEREVGGGGGGGGGGGRLQTNRLSRHQTLIRDNLINNWWAGGLMEWVATLEGRGGLSK